MVYLDSAHKIMLSRNDGNTFMEHIITGLAAMFVGYFAGRKNRDAGDI